MRSTPLTTAITHTRSRDLEASSIYWISHQENRDERKRLAITLFQVKTNLTTLAELTKPILFDRKIFRKNSPKKCMHFDKTSPKKRNPQQQKKSRNATKQPAQLCEKNAQLATLTLTAVN